MQFKKKKRDPRAVRRQNKDMRLMGLGTKYHYAGEDQQQFNSQTVSLGKNRCLLWKSYEAHKHSVDR
jgi:hypothetical protein